VIPCLQRLLGVGMLLPKGTRGLEGNNSHGVLYRAPDLGTKEGRALNFCLLFGL
jgi:hypothetical protein